jgi:hypothetical protein
VQQPKARLPPQIVDDGAHHRSIGRESHFIVGRIPSAVAISVLTIAVILGAWKLAKFFWLMLAG